MYLIDTHIALWWLAGDKRLGPRTIELLNSEECLLSAVSLWEVEIKHSIGKLPCSAFDLKLEMTDAGTSILPIYDRHICLLDKIITDHNDPFDRLLLATALSEGTKFVTADSQLLKVRSLPIIDASD